jgi:hypothetical protein
LATFLNSVVRDSNAEHIDNPYTWDSEGDCCSWKVIKGHHPHGGAIPSGRAQQEIGSFSATIEIHVNLGCAGSWFWSHHFFSPTFDQSRGLR